MFLNPFIFAIFYKFEVVSNKNTFSKLLTGGQCPHPADSLIFDLHCIFNVVLNLLNEFEESLHKNSDFQYFLGEKIQRNQQF